ncbi:MAG: DUF262 domain-containing protein [Patescibacteria group bacterium]
MSKVNLDALIPRADFESAGADNSLNYFDKITISSYQTNLFYPFLRKPDFQRETSEWDIKKNYDFIKSFIDGDLIPSIILWRSQSGFYFVIDGAHRLSALTSWILDDYGDGDASLKFYNNAISEDQKEIANNARKYINKNLGAYKDIIESTNSSNPNSEYIKIAKNLGAHSLQVQWISGNAKKAEQSFFKINQQGVPLNNTEIKLLQSRKKGNCIAARAIIRAGSGHKYWSEFSAENQKTIQEISEEINKILFSPPLKSPIKSLDYLPIAGKISSTQALPLIFDFINITNVIPLDFKDKINDDLNGEETLKYLKNVRKIAWRINSVHPSSLGLHPAVYFYSSDGRHKTASFYAIATFIQELENKNEFNKFIKVRDKFEELLLSYDYLIQDINRHYRQAMKSYVHIKDFYMDCIEMLGAGETIKEMIEGIVKIPKYKYLKTSHPAIDIVKSGEFTKERKSAVFIKDALKNATRCKICNGHLHVNSITIDHINRKEDGGLGNIDNGQITHPYCNTTVKN